MTRSGFQPSRGISDRRNAVGWPETRLRFVHGIPLLDSLRTLALAPENAVARHDLAALDSARGGTGDRPRRASSACCSPTTDADARQGLGMVAITALGRIHLMNLIAFLGTALLGIRHPTVGLVLVGAQLVGSRQSLRAYRGA